jgi:N-acetylneuraminic acid mutarotase
MEYDSVNRVIYVFGGLGYDDAGLFGYLNDVWVFNVKSGWWTWTSGNNIATQKGILLVCIVDEKKFILESQSYQATDQATDQATTMRSRVA